MQIREQINQLLAQDINQVLSKQQSMFDNLVGNDYPDFVVFGSGYLGKKVIKGLKKLGIQPLAIADNNQKLWHTSIEGIIVLSPQEAVNKFGQKAVFVIAIYNTSAPRQQLTELNCHKFISYAYLFSKYAEIFLPHACLDFPYQMYQQAEDVYKALDLWADEASRQQYLAQLRWRLFLDFDQAKPISTSLKEREYFPLNTYSELSGEVFVDCGAFNGDTIQRFLSLRNHTFKNIIGIEPDPVNFQNLQNYVSTLQYQNEITLLQAAVSSQAGKLNFDVTGSAASSISDQGTIEVNCISLDDAIADYKPTLIKMDLEGFELEAITGAKNIISQGKTVLAITVYHCQDHLWRIPLLINSYSSNYRFFLIPHAEDCWDISCYAVPIERLLS